MIHPALRAYSEGRRAEALTIAAKSLCSNPSDQRSLHVLMLIKSDQGDFSSALHVAKIAITCQADFAEIFINAGYCLQKIGESKDAHVSYRKGIALAPSSPEASYNTGVLDHQQADWWSAEKWYRRAIKLRPAWADVEFNLAQICLIDGRFQEGWQLYESRREMTGVKGSKPARLPGILWDKKSSLHGKRLLLACEQGLGDSIQFFRYALHAANLGAQVTLISPKPLLKIFSSSGRIRVVETDEGVQDIDLNFSLMSMPEALGTRVSTVPYSTERYLTANVEDIDRWRPLVTTTEGRLKVGLAWRAGRVSKIAGRDIPLEDLLALSELDVDFHSLNKEIDIDDQPALRKFPSLAPHTGKHTDFSVTAGLISLMDLVISVDTSVAHLAAAMGKSTWIALPKIPDWRWQKHGNESIWYPKTRLFRQHCAGDWQGVVSEIHAALQAILKNPK